MGSSDQWPRLTAEGYQILFAFNDAAGVDVTPDEFADGLEEAEERITGGPCRGCGRLDGDFRYGWCYECATEAEAEAEAG